MQYPGKEPKSKLEGSGRGVARGTTVISLGRTRNSVLYYMSPQERRNIVYQYQLTTFSFEFYLGL